MSDEKKVKGYSLKKNAFKKWIFENNLTLIYVSRKLGISKEELKKRLSKHLLFNKNEIIRLIYLVEAKNAINIIYFPSLKEKKEVIKKVFKEKGVIYNYKIKS